MPAAALAALFVALFDVGALDCELAAVGFGGAQRLALRQEEVAGVAVLDGDFVADVAVTADALEQNDFHLFSNAVPAAARICREHG